VLFSKPSLESGSAGAGWREGEKVRLHGDCWQRGLDFRRDPLKLVYATALKFSTGTSPGKEPGRGKEEKRAEPPGGRGIADQMKGKQGGELRGMRAFLGKKGSQGAH